MTEEEKNIIIDHKAKINNGDFWPVLEKLQELSYYDDDETSGALKGLASEFIMLNPHLFDGKTIDELMFGITDSENETKSYVFSALNLKIRDATIGNSAFKGSKLTGTLTLNDCSLDQYAFSSTKIEKLIANNLSCRYAGAFRDCYDLTEVSITDCDKLGRATFSGCLNLKRVRLKYIDDIAQGAFGPINKSTVFEIPKDDEDTKAALLEAYPDANIKLV